MPFSKENEKEFESSPLIEELEEAEAEEGQAANSKLLFGTGIIAIVLAGNVVRFRSSRHTPGKDTATVYEAMHNEKLFRGGVYKKKPPWLVRKYGKDNVTAAMIEEDIEARFLERRAFRETISLNAWKEMRLQRLNKKEQSLSAAELAAQEEIIRQGRLDAMYRGKLMSEEDRKEYERLFKSPEAQEQRKWEYERAAFFAPMFGKGPLNLTGEDLPYHFAEYHAQKVAAIDVELLMENLMQTFENLSRKQGQDYYKVLGLKKDADVESVKQAYRKELMKWHPDTYEGNNPEEAARKFSLVNNAYQLLANEEARKKYDKMEEEFEKADKQKSNRD